MKVANRAVYSMCSSSIPHPSHRGNTRQVHIGPVRICQAVNYDVYASNTLTATLLGLVMEKEN